MFKTKELETIYKNEINKTKTENKNKHKTQMKRKEDDFFFIEKNCCHIKFMFTLSPFNFPVLKSTQ